MSREAATVACWDVLGLDPAEPTHRRTLVEASAGTGKTWTIAALYLRLLLEGGHRATQIVVSTFTDAAAQELRDRIRERVQQVLRWSQDDAATNHDDPVAQWAVRRWQSQPSSRRDDAARLRLALSELDLAPIGTLHALCRRVLADAPFSASASLQPGEIVSAERIHGEIADDLLRLLAQRSWADARENASAAAWMNKSHAERVRVVATLLRPGVERDGSDVTLEPEWTDACANIDALRALYDSDLFARSNSALRSFTARMIEWLSAGDATQTPDLSKFDEDDLPKQAKQGRVDALTAHPGFACLKRLVLKARQVDDAASSRFHRWMAAQAQHWLDERLSVRHQLTFDALIFRVDDGIRRSVLGESTLADDLFAQWPVALIDEFQDTDARQYALFDALYRDADGSPRGLLLMIGDPKQAIYRFRGGDIDAYVRAAGRATQRLMLTENFRSSARYVDAINGFYRAVEDGFERAASGLDYQPVTAAGHADRTPLRNADGNVGDALRIVELDAVDVDAALSACADAIADALMPGRLRIGDAAMHPGDIAVLLPSHRDIQTLRQLLHRRRVPCVATGRESVFASEWARDLRVVLHAVTGNPRAGVVRAALATTLIGLDAGALQALDHQTAHWRDWLDRFADWSRLWREQGVLRVVDAVLERAAPRLLARPDGERAMTDLRHLGELLQAADDALHGPEALLAWFAHQSADAEGDAADADERRMRIESDRARVQLMTVHVSKGLEFPVVFLPLMWKLSPRADVFPVVTVADGTRHMDLGSAQYAARQAQDMAQQRLEHLRLLYVALTRAKYACQLSVPSLSGDDTPSPGARRVHDTAFMRLWQRADRAVLHRCDAIAFVSPLAETVEVAWPSSQPDARIVRVARERHRVLGSHSFSSLTQGIDATPLHTIEPPAADEPQVPVEASEMGGDTDEHPELVAFADWGSTDFGNAVHAMFEHRRIGVPFREQRAFVARQFVDAGIAIDDAQRDRRVAAWCARLDACLDTPLWPGLRLGAVAAHEQRAEMAFQFALNDVRLSQLRNCCAAHGAADLVPKRIDRRVLSGFLVGKIDLVFACDGRFHVLDYKSNFLGRGVASYRGAALEAAMLREHYPFQALLYTLALDRHLAQCLPTYAREQHLGDCVYLFVRAVGLGDDAGVWRHRFTPTLIDAAQAVMSARDPGVVA